MNDILEQAVWFGLGFLAASFFRAMFVNHKTVELMEFWKNSFEKQSKQLKWINDNLVYVSVSELPELYEGFIDNEFPEDTVLLMLNPEREEDKYFV